MNGVVPPPMPAQIISPLQVKDSRWLTLEVCREFQRNKCTRTDQECKFAHPPSNVEVQNGRVICCYDSIKGKCQRKDPPCKYLHPPQHLREQLLQNGRNNLLMKNIQQQMQWVPTGPKFSDINMQNALQQMLAPQPMQHIVPPVGNIVPHYLSSGPLPIMGPLFTPHMGATFNPYQPQMPTLGTPMSIPGMEGTAASPPAVSVASTLAGVMPGAAQSPSIQQATSQTTPVLPTTQKVQRADRLEPLATSVASSSPADMSDLGYPTSYGIESMPQQHQAHTPSQISPVYFQPQVVEALAAAAAGKKRPRDPTDDYILQGMSGLQHNGMMPVLKRQAIDNKGIPIQLTAPHPHLLGAPQLGPASTAAYQQALAAHFHIQPSPFGHVTIAGQPPGLQRF